MKVIKDDNVNSFPILKVSGITNVSLYRSLLGQQFTADSNVIPFIVPRLPHSGNV